jgi:uncharacterized protein with HEPN domain
MSRSALDYLRHIQDEADYLIGSAEGLTKDEFVRDEPLKRAFVRSLAIIGEAVKKMPEEFKERHTRLDWRAMAGMRDRLIHGYFGLGYDIVWDVVVSKVPMPRRELLQILQADDRSR